jgi:hypothetical protein
MTRPCTHRTTTGSGEAGTEARACCNDGEREVAVVGEKMGVLGGNGLTLCEGLRDEMREVGVATRENGDVVTDLVCEREAVAKVKGVASFNAEWEGAVAVSASFEEGGVIEGLDRAVPAIVMREGEIVSATDLLSPASSG